MISGVVSFFKPLALLINVAESRKPPERKLASCAPGRCFRDLRKHPIESRNNRLCPSQDAPGAPSVAKAKFAVHSGSRVHPLLVQLYQSRAD